tara:strand:+ start:19431 stop:20006 length:576 start_codon:yes stop_codon:yes gene_type:complete
MNKKILIIGAGGIGSYLIPLLDRLGCYTLTVYDNDTIEKKNLLYQNYQEEDISLNKAEVMMQRYSSVFGQPYPVLTVNQIQGYDLVICCADNLTVRRLIYMSNQGRLGRIEWLDLRAQGRNGALISFKINDKMADTLLEGPDGSYSCQAGDWAGKATGVNLTHAIIAGMGAQWTHRHLNGDKVTEYMMVSI